MEKSSLSKIAYILDQSKSWVLETRPLVSMNIPAFGSLDFHSCRDVFDVVFLGTGDAISARNSTTMVKNYYSVKNNRINGRKELTYR